MDPMSIGIKDGQKSNKDRKKPYFHAIQSRTGHDENISLEQGLDLIFS